MKSIFTGTLLCLATWCSFAQNRTIEFKHDNPFDAVLKQAKQENKLIFLDAYTSWCVPCKQMAKDVFTVDSIADFFNGNFINVGYDMEKGEGITLKKRYSSDITAYPTLLFIDADGVVVHKIVGAPSVKDMITLSKPALDPKESLQGLAKRYEGGDHSLSTLVAYFKVLSNAGDRNKIKETATVHFDALPTADLKRPEVWEVMSKYLFNIDSKSFNDVFNNRKEFAAAIGKEKVEKYLLNSFSGEVGAASNAFYMKTPVDKARQAKVIKMLKTIDNKTAEEYLLRLELCDARSEGDWARFNKGMLRLIGTKSPVNSLTTRAGYMMNFTRKFVGVAPDKALSYGLSWADLLLKQDLDPVYKTDLLNFKKNIYAHLKETAMLDKVAVDIAAQQKLKAEGEAKGVRYNSAIRGFM